MSFQPVAVPQKCCTDTTRAVITGGRHLVRTAPTDSLPTSRYYYREYPGSADVATSGSYSRISVSSTQVQLDLPELLLIVL